MRTVRLSSGRPVVRAVCTAALFCMAALTPNPAWPSEVIDQLVELVAEPHGIHAHELIGSLFTEGFLRDVGAESVLATARAMRRSHGTVVAVSAAGGPGAGTAHHAAAEELQPYEYELLFADGQVRAVSIYLEADSHSAARGTGSIAGLQLGRPRSLESLLEYRVGRLELAHQDTVVFVAPLGGRPVFERATEAKTDAAMGSAGGRRATEDSVLMYPGEPMEDLRLLFRVVRGVAERSIDLSNVVRLDQRYMAGNGPLAAKAPGTPYTLYSLVEYLLIEQDRTARRHIEAALTARGGRAAADVSWSYRTLYELLSRSTVLGTMDYTPISYLLMPVFITAAEGDRAAAVLLVSGREGGVYYVAVSQYDAYEAPSSEVLRRDIELLAVPLRLLP